MASDFAGKGVGLPERKSSLRRREKGKDRTLLMEWREGKASGLVLPSGGGRKKIAGPLRLLQRHVLLFFRRRGLSAGRKRREGGGIPFFAKKGVEQG